MESCLGKKMVREARRKCLALLTIHEGRGQLTITNGVINIQRKFYNTSLELICKLYDEAI